MANLEKFIEQIRLEIGVYYEKLYFSDNEIDVFNEFFKSKDFTEDLLKIHEEKLEDLKFKYTESQTLYEKTFKWLELWRQFITFEEKTKDPSRFKVRGYNGAEEEKSRKQFQLQFPKLEDELKRLSDEYEKTNGGETFQIYGYEWNIYFEMLKKDYENHKLNEKKEKQAAAAGNANNNNYNNNVNKKDTFINKHTSKLITPLNNQKITSVKRKNDLYLQQTPSIMRNSKLQRTDCNNDDNTLTSTISATPGTAKFNKLLNKNTSKRKSRTPMKQRLRQSKQLTSKNVSVASKANSTTTMNSKASNSPSKTANKYKMPTRFKQQSQMSSNENESADTTLTATSNTTAISKISSLTHHTTASSSTSTASTTQHHYHHVSTYKQSGYPFRHVNTNDINYHEFTRDLNKPFRFNAITPNNADNDIKTKLTSTLIKE